MNQSEFEEIHNWCQERENVTRVTSVFSDSLNKQNLCSTVTLLLSKIRAALTITFQSQAKQVHHPNNKHRQTQSARRRDEMRLIFHFGNLRPHGLNVDFIL